jgi:hypothetical protein
VLPCLAPASPSDSFLIQPVFFTRVPQFPKSNIRSKIEVDAKRRKEEIEALFTSTHTIPLCLSFFNGLSHTTLCYSSYGDSFHASVISPPSPFKLFYNSVILPAKLRDCSIESVSRQNGRSKSKFVFFVFSHFINCLIHTRTHTHTFISCTLISYLYTHVTYIHSYYIHQKVKSCAFIRQGYIWEKWMYNSTYS